MRTVSGQFSPVEKVKPGMRMSHVPRGPSHACRRATRASAKHHTTHATCEAIGSRGIGRRTGHLSSLAPVTQPLKKEVAPTAIASGETTSFRVATSESEKVEIPIFCFPCARLAKELKKSEDRALLGQLITLKEKQHKLHARSRNRTTARGARRPDSAREASGTRERVNLAVRTSLAGR